MALNHHNSEYVPRLIPQSFRQPKLAVDLFRD